MTTTTTTTKGIKEQPAIFGLYQPYVAQAYFQLIYILWYFCNFHFVYAVFTLNYPVIAFYLAVTVLQTFVGRSESYVRFVTDVIQVRKGLKKAEVIYEEEIGKDEKCVFAFHPHGVLAASVLVFMN